MRRRSVKHLGIADAFRNALFLYSSRVKTFTGGQARAVKHFSKQAEFPDALT